MASSYKKRVTIFFKDTHRLGNQSITQAKVFPVPNCIEELLENIREKFHLDQEKTEPDDDGQEQSQQSRTIKLLTAKGAEIENVELIRDDETLYLCLDDETWPSSSVQQSKSNPGSRRSSWSSSNKEWIKLNIGGKIFTTTRSTIVAKEPESMLAKMFECDDYGHRTCSFKTTTNCDGDQNGTLRKSPLHCRDKSNRTCIVPSLIDDQGAYMIDRSPEYFEPLIGYLRHGNLIMDKHLNPMGVLEEAKFYGFYSLVPELEAIILQESLLQNTIERSIGLAPLTRKDVVKAIIQTSTETRLRFQGVNLSGADLSRLDLSNINFKYATLRGASLQGATLKNCCLERADMSKCNLEGASLINCHMVCCNLEGSILRGSNMDSQSFTELTNLEGANLNNVNLEGSKMHRVNLRIASLKNANVQNCILDYACLAGANLENCDLSGSDLNEVNLRGANLKGTRFDLIHTPLHMFYLTS